jgi:hypothetical protein
LTGHLRRSVHAPLPEPDMAVSGFGFQFKNISPAAGEISLILGADTV